jgi:hypothetical protein
MTNIVWFSPYPLPRSQAFRFPPRNKRRDRCVLKEDSTEKIADCDKVLRKNASPFDELARRNRGLLPER